MITINLTNLQANVDGITYEITELEAKVFRILSKDKYKSTEEINEVISGTKFVCSGVCRNFLSQLRKRLGAFIVCKRAVGYKLANFVFIEESEEESIGFAIYLRNNIGVRFCVCTNEEIKDIYQIWANKHKNYGINSQIG